MIESARVEVDHFEADEFIRRLEESKKKKDLTRLAEVAIRFEVFARTGTLETSRELNHLRGEISEIKAGDVRLPFFESACAGRKTIRLTHGFIKKSQHAPRREIDKAFWVMRKDSES